MDRAVEPNANTSEVALDGLAPIIIWIHSMPLQLHGFRFANNPSSGAKSSRPSPGIQEQTQHMDEFKTEETGSGSRLTVVPEGFAHLVHQRIAREGFLKEEALLQEVFVASVVFKIARHVNDPQAGPETL